MARTKDELRDHMLDIGPGFICEPEELLDAMLLLSAAMSSTVEQAIDTQHARTFVCEADGAWLDQHGKERGILRLEGEPDDPDYRARVKTIEDAVTAPAIQFALDSLLAVGKARIADCLEDSLFLDFPDIQGFPDLSPLIDTQRCFIVTILKQVSGKAERDYLLETGDSTTPVPSQGFLGEHGDAGSPAAGLFLDGLETAPSDIYSRIWEEIDRLRAAGVTFRVCVE